MLQRAMPDRSPVSMSSVPTGLLCRLMQIAGERGIDSAAWCAGLQLEPEEIADPSTRVSYRQAGEFILRAVRALGQPDLGLQVGGQQHPGNFGLIGLAMQTAPGFGEAVRLGMAYQRVTGTLMEVELDDGHDTEASVVARAPDAPAEILPFLCEELFLSSALVARELLGPGFRPLRVALAYPAPAYADRYAELFGCEVRFGQPRNALTLDKAWLAVEFPGYNPVTARLAQDLCRQQLDSIRAPQGETTASVERYLRRHLSGNPPLAAIAGHLHLSERTLRRRLAAEGASFNALHDRVRTECAMRLLHDTRLNIAQIGMRVGFNDAREFRRAFKRWTGRTPSEVRTGES
ncbi:MAG: AraC family transcriptional regulator [Pseudoxanthomonas sp.]